MSKHIEDFQRLNIKVNDIPKEHRVSVFIGTLQNNIQHDIFLWEHNSLEKAFKMTRKVEIKKYGNKEVYHSQL